MPDITEIYGKRLKSAAPKKIFVGFPGSDVIETLPAGKPSAKIDSYINRPEGGFYQLEGTPNKYLKDTPAVKVVPEAAPDESAFLSGLTGSVFDFWNNTATTAGKQAGFLSEGFDKATADLTADFESFSDQIKPVLYLVIAVVLLLIIKDFTD